jgi:hypothetical protein
LKDHSSLNDLILQSHKSVRLGQLASIRLKLLGTHVVQTAMTAEVIDDLPATDAVAIPRWKL